MKMPQLKEAASARALNGGAGVAPGRCRVCQRALVRLGSGVLGCVQRHHAGAAAGVPSVGGCLCACAGPGGRRRACLTARTHAHTARRIGFCACAVRKTKTKAAAAGALRARCGREQGATLAPQPGSWCGGGAARDRRQRDPQAGGRGWGARSTARAPLNEAGTSARDCAGWETGGAVAGDARRNRVPRRHHHHLPGPV